MKKHIIKIFILLFIGAFMAACTDGFEDFNTDTTGVTDKELEADFHDVGSYVKSMEQYIFNVEPGYQVETNLTADAFAQYWVPPNPFMANRMNVTYNFTWYSQMWENVFNNVMYNDNVMKRKGLAAKYPNYAAWATILKIFSMQKVTDYYGPVIYSDYAVDKDDVHFDSQKNIYYAFFDELDVAIDTLTKYAIDSSKAFEKYDLAYDGSAYQWVKVANSLRLRLAVRIANVDPTKAKEEAEKAVSQRYGLIETPADDFFVDIENRTHPLEIISDQWGDTRMCATVESILGGYGDPRLEQYFSAATDASLPAKTYKGIRQGIDISSKDTYIGFSAAGPVIVGSKKVQIMTSAEINFLRAEGALRGWDMGKTAKEYYEAGVTASFEQHGLSSASDYLNNDTSTFADYTDPINPDNSFKASSNITIKWDDATSNEEKLEKIITQKWIALFPNGQEAWSEFRRTGYPKLIPVVVNYSNEKISTAEFVRRVPYPDAEYETEKSVVTDAVNTYLNGNDTGGERLWWDTGSNNF